MKTLEFSSALSLRRCLKRGIGVSILPKNVVFEDLKRGELKQLALEPDPPETGLIMIWHAEKWCSPLLKRYMQTAERMMGSE